VKGEGHVSLLGEERKSQIMQWLEEEGKVMTKDLIDRLDVSGETVRRYLEELERERQLKRVYGGAIYHGGKQESSISRRTDQLSRRLARYAKGWLSDYSCIFLGKGEPVEHLLPYLSGGATIVTNSLSIASHLEQCRETGPFHGEIRLLGGTVDSFGQTVGVEVLQALDAYAFDASFLTFDGAEIERGFVSDDIESSLIQKAIIGRTKDVYAFLACDEFEGNRKYKVAEFRRAKIVLSPSTYPPSWEMKLFNERVNWTVVS